MRIGFANGCFDLFHRGHEYFIEECVRQCDRLMIAVNTDVSVSALKPGRPIETLSTRMKSVAEYLVDSVVPFDGDVKRVLQIVRPDILFRGSDQTVTDFERAMFGGNIIVIPRLPGFSTTEELARLATTDPAAVSYPREVMTVSREGSKRKFVVLEDHRTDDHRRLTK